MSTTVAGTIPTYLPRADRADRRIYPPRHHSRYAAATLVRRAIEAAIRDHLAPLKPSTVVDFGCGNSPYRALFAPHVGRYLGVDLPGNATADYHLLADGSTTVPAEFADVVLSTQVLEHVPDPAAYFREAWRMLKPGGLLMLSTHGYWLYHPDPTDYWRYTGPGLRRLAELNGFETVGFEGAMGLLPAGLQLSYDGLVRRVLPKKLRPVVGPAVSLLMQTPLVWLDALHTPEQRRQDAAAFLLVARKTA